MIQPTPGRIVWFFPSIEAGRDPNGQPLAAMLAKVLHERCVNLTVFHADGSSYPAQGIQLLQDDDAEPDTAYACWMPFQKGQAAKHEAPGSLPTLTPEQIASIHHAIDTLAMTSQARIAEVDAKANQIGELTLAKLTNFEARLAALQAPAEPAKSTEPSLNSI